MVLKFYNTLGRKKQEFKPLNDKKVTMYNCGPTIYGLPHVGNFRAFVFADLVRRYLEFKGYNVFQVMNLTDIDDKTIRDSKVAGLSLREFTDMHAKEFFWGLDKLGNLRAQVYPRATEHIQDMISHIEKLLETGVAYESNGSVYYSVRKFKNYGKLSQVDLTGLQAGARVDVDEYDKDQPQDFALWKRATPDEIERKIYYESPWGKGRPGWHIECTVMSMRYLGETFDIHTGGVDLIFPHHENEIAQAEPVTKKPFVKYWLHNGHLIVNGAKMSKSKGNYFTLHDLVKKYDVDTIRYFFASAPYRQELNYTEQSIKDAENNVKKLKNTLSDMLSILGSTNDEAPFGKEEQTLLDALQKRMNEFETKMDDDLDTPAGLRVFSDLSSDINKYMAKGYNKGIVMEALQAYMKVMQVFGFVFTTPTSSGLENDLMNIIIDVRNEERKKKNFKLTDQIRDKLDALGIQLKDDGEKTKWVRK